MASARVIRADGLVEFGSPVGQHVPEVVERVGVGWLGRDDFAERLLGLVEALGAIVGGRQIEQKLRIRAVAPPRLFEHASRHGRPPRCVRGRWPASPREVRTIRWPRLRRGRPERPDPAWRPRFDSHRAPPGVRQREGSAWIGRIDLGDVPRVLFGPRRVAGPPVDLREQIPRADVARRLLGDRRERLAAGRDVAGVDERRRLDGAGMPGCGDCSSANRVHARAADFQSPVRSCSSASHAQDARLIRLVARPTACTTSIAEAS